MALNWQAVYSYKNKPPGREHFLSLLCEIKRRNVLRVATAYIVLAITDTNNDLYYNPLDDWWGMYEDDAGLATVVTKMNTGEKDSLYNASIHITLQAPAGEND